MTYRDATTGANVSGTVRFTDGAGSSATATTGSTIILSAGTRLRIDAPGYSRKESDARSQVDGAYWGIPESLQAEIDLARGAGGLRRPGLDKSFDVVIDRLTFSKAQRDAIQALMEAAAPTVTASRYAWTFKRRDDPDARPGTYAVVVAGAGTFTPFLNGEEIVGGKIGIDPTVPQAELESTVRLLTARMVGFDGSDYSNDPMVYLALTRLPIGNRAPNVDP